MTPEQLAEWKRLADAATPGPWDGTNADAPWPDPVWCGPLNGWPVAWAYSRTIEERRANIALIAAARTAVPALIAEVERLRAALEPFARWARHPHLTTDDDLTLLCVHTAEDAEHTPTVGDLRRARDALEDRPHAL